MREEIADDCTQEALSTYVCTLRKQDDPLHLVKFYANLHLLLGFGAFARRMRGRMPYQTIIVVRLKLNRDNVLYQRGEVSSVNFRHRTQQASGAVVDRHINRETALGA